MPLPLSNCLLRCPTLAHASPHALPPSICRFPLCSGFWSQSPSCLVLGPLLILHAVFVAQDGHGVSFAPIVTHSVFGESHHRSLSLPTSSRSSTSDLGSELALGQIIMAGVEGGPAIWLGSQSWHVLYMPEDIVCPDEQVSVPLLEPVFLPGEPWGSAPDSSPQLASLVVKDILNAPADPNVLRSKWFCDGAICPLCDQWHGNIIGYSKAWVFLSCPNKTWLAGSAGRAKTDTKVYRKPRGPRQKFRRVRWWHPCWHVTMERSPNGDKAWEGRNLLSLAMSFSGVEVHSL